MHDDLKARAQDAVALAKAKGANDARATAYRGRSVSYSVRDGKLEEVQDTTTLSVSFDLYVDGRYSTHSTSDLAPQRFQRLADGRGRRSPAVSGRQFLS